jgi:hypothetical protein
MNDDDDTEEGEEGATLAGERWLYGDLTQHGDTLVADDGVCFYKTARGEVRSNRGGDFPLSLAPDTAIDDPVEHFGAVLASPLVATVRLSLQPWAHRAALARLFEPAPDPCVFWKEIVVGYYHGRPSLVEVCDQPEYLPRDYQRNCFLEWRELALQSADDKYSMISFFHLSDNADAAAYTPFAFLHACVLVRAHDSVDAPISLPSPRPLLCVALRVRCASDWHAQLTPLAASLAGTLIGTVRVSEPVRCASVVPGLRDNRHLQYDASTPLQHRISYETNTLAAREWRTLHARILELTLLLASSFRVHTFVVRAILLRCVEHYNLARSERVGALIDGVLQSVWRRRPSLCPLRW